MGGWVGGWVGQGAEPHKLRWFVYKGKWAVDPRVHASFPEFGPPRRPLQAGYYDKEAMWIPVAILDNRGAGRGWGLLPVLLPFPPEENSWGRFPLCLQGPPQPQTEPTQLSFALAVSPC